MKITHIEQFVTAVPHIPEIQKSRPADFTFGDLHTSLKPGSGWNWIWRR